MEGPAPATAADDRPGDQEILAHEQELREQAESVPLVGPQDSLELLKAQYADNAGFLPKVQALEQRFASMRRTRPDGNCFYRAYLFGIFEQLLGQKERLAAFTARARTFLDTCMKAGYEKVAVEDFHDEFTACLMQLAVEGASMSLVENMLKECDGYLVCWMRILTSTYLKLHKDDYEAFLSSHASIAEFCTQEVDPMCTEADHLQIAALSSCLGVPVCVVYLDRSEGETAAEHVFEGDSASGVAGFPTVHLLYRPGHYDLIYPR
uniref:ubiquitinyl hydrolase 1 n=1 Tax=Alexandrium monilatum TaxID=311494 RepID=A0A6T1A9U3_9DINO